MLLFADTKDVKKLNTSGFTCGIERSRPSNTFDLIHLYSSRFYTVHWADGRGFVECL